MKADFRAERVEENTNRGDAGGAFSAFLKVLPKL